MQISHSINENLSERIDEAFKTYRPYIEKIEGNRINYLNIYHKAWAEKPNQDLVELMSQQTGVPVPEILSLGFINARIGCNVQHYHIDYEGNTETYFIPLVDLNAFNGTEFLKFDSVDTNLKYYDTLLSVSNKYVERDLLVEKLDQLKVPRSAYSFEIVQTRVKSIIYVPFYVLHRGRTNTSAMDRIMFQMVKTRYPGYRLHDGVVVADAELDESPQNTFFILKNRSRGGRGILSRWIAKFTR